MIEKQKESLEAQHKRERDRRMVNRIKAVLLYSEGWTQIIDIAQALRIRPETVHDHLKDFESSQKLKQSNGGSETYLTQQQRTAIIEHLDQQIYTKVSDICVYVYETYGIKFTVSRRTKWFQGFSYKRSKGIPAKADSQQQAEFKSIHPVTSHGVD